MPRIQYISKNFSKQQYNIITHAINILSEYYRGGYEVTLRTLYYQFVSRDIFANKQSNYKMLGHVISDARRCGLIDWNYISDITRHTRSPSFWDTPKDILSSCKDSFDIDWWDDQAYRPEVFVEKDALLGVLRVACSKWNCPYLSCRGYTSDSELWQASQRMLKNISNGYIPLIIHLGDHDPSGVDMSRDIFERIKLFTKNAHVEVKRVALNMDQIELYKPPPNPAKVKDPRFKEYEDNFGDESWELDALNPTTITEIISTEMLKIVDMKSWKLKEAIRDEGRRLLGVATERWDKLIKTKPFKKKTK